MNMFLENIFYYSIIGTKPPNFFYSPTLYVLVKEKKPTGIMEL